MGGPASVGSNLCASEAQTDDDDFGVGLAALSEAAGDSIKAVAAATGLVMFTPACLAINSLGQGLAELDRERLTVIFLRRIRLQEPEVRRIWRYQAESFSPTRWNVAVRAFCAGPAVVAVVRAPPTNGRDLSVRLKHLKGPSDPLELESHHLRARLGAPNKINNLMHSPDSVDALIRESAIMLPPSGLRAMWRAAVDGRSVTEYDSFIEANRVAVAEDGLGIVRVLARLRWRCLECGRQLALTEGPQTLMATLREQLSWSRTVMKDIDAPRRWRERYAETETSKQFGEWLGMEAIPEAELLCRVFDALECVLLQLPVDVEILEHELGAVHLALDEWENLAVATEVVAQAVRRCA
jgi:hypothetical protein